MASESRARYRPAPPGYSYVGAGVRLGALIIDGIILFVPVLAATLAVVMLLEILGLVSVDDESSSAATGIAGWLDLFIVYVVTSVLMLAWYGLWQSKTGSTPGMKIFKLRVVGPTMDAKPTFTAAVVRNAPMTLGSFGQIGDNEGVNALLTLVTLAVYTAIGVSINHNPARQGLHDRLAGGTYVIVPGGPLPPAPPPPPDPPAAPAAPQELRQP